MRKIQTFSNQKSNFFKIVRFFSQLDQLNFYELKRFTCYEKKSDDSVSHLRKKPNAS